MDIAGGFGTCKMQIGAACYRLQWNGEAATAVGAQVYGSAAVARASGVGRATFNSWVLRKHLPLSAGPGTGRARHYGLLDAVRCAAFARMQSMGILPARAGSVVTAIDRVPLPGDVLLLTAHPRFGSLAAVINYGSDGPTQADIRAFSARIVGERGSMVAQIDLFELGEHVKLALLDPDMEGVGLPDYEAHAVLHGHVRAA